MKKRGFSFYRFICILFLIGFYQINTYSQCTNPTPNGQIAQSFCKSSNPTISNLVASGGLIEWFDSPTSDTKLSSNTLLVDTKKYYADDKSGNNCSSIRLEVTVSILGNYPAFVNIFVGKCSSDNATIASLSAIGENIQWYDAQFGGNLLPTNLVLQNGRTYWVQQTEGGCASGRLPTTVTIIDPPAPIVDPIQSFCSIAPITISNLVALGTNITWYTSETDDTPLGINEVVESGKTYWASQNTFPCESIHRSSTKVFVDVPPNTGSSNSIILCESNLNNFNLFESLGGNADPNGIWTGPSNLTNDYLGTFNPTINTLGTYTYTVSSNLNICPNSSSQITISSINTIF